VIGEGTTPGSTMSRGPVSAFCRSRYGRVRLDLAHADVFIEAHVIPDEVLADHTDRLPE